MADEEMPKLDLKKDLSKLSWVERVWMKRCEDHNIERVKKLQLYRKKNNVSLVVLSSIVVGIYVYTICSFKQEKFLDDFDEPEKVIEKKQIALPPLATSRDLVKLYKLSAVKRLSQNFLLDERLTDKIVKKAGNLGDGQVLEIGPGPGSITRSIIKKGPKRLIVVEKDPRFKPSLEMLAEAFQLANGRMDILIDDILNVNMTNIFPQEAKREWNDKPPDIHLIGNLPFSISTHLIIKWLQAMSERSGAWAFGRTKMTLTFQKEVAERLVAPAHGEQRCRLSVMAQTWTYPILRFVIPGTAFVPKPDVDVGVVTFTPLVTPRTQHDFKLYEKITRHIFSFRQKYNIRCVETLFPPDSRHELASLMFKLANLDPTMKSIELEVGDVDRLVSAYKFILEKHPEVGMYNYRASRKILPLKYTQDIEVESYDEP